MLHNITKQNLRSIGKEPANKEDEEEATNTKEPAKWPNTKKEQEPQTLIVLEHHQSDANDVQHGAMKGGAAVVDEREGIGCFANGAEEWATRVHILSRETKMTLFVF